MPIRVLSSQVASQIAAGEVVERPSSAVKELVENAIDAGGQTVHLEVRRGGKEFIRVADDGCGILREEVELAFERHSTSKLSSVADLDSIATLGFRGEALASIAAVSRLTIVTRSVDEEVGTLLKLEGGEVVSHSPSGRPPGTTVTVEDLFFNVPARAKFLRSDLTERRHIDAWVTRYAMAYPNLQLTVAHDGKEKFRSPGTGNLRDVLVEVYGAEVGASLLDIPPDASAEGTHQVTGLVSPPALHRGNRDAITLFINGRWVRDSRLTYAISQAYHTLMPSQRYPIAVVMLTMPPQEVDVNVHPAKTEVRFRDGDAIFRLVQRAVRRTVVGGAPVPEMGVQSSSAWQPRHRPAFHSPEPEVSAPTLFSGPRLPESGPSDMPPLRVVGQVAGTFIVAESADGLYLIDQHAAHERVLYEQLMADLTVDEGVAQGLLEPATVEVSPQTASLVEENLDLLAELGMQVEPFGGNTFLVRTLPVILAHARPAEVLLEVSEALEGAESRVREEIEQAVVRRICKRAAVKAGQVLTREEMEELIRGLEKCASPRTCPHGRPTMIRMSVEHLARQFGR